MNSSVSSSAYSSKRFRLFDVERLERAEARRGEDIQDHRIVINDECKRAAIVIDNIVHAQECAGLI